MSERSARVLGFVVGFCLVLPVLIPGGAAIAAAMLPALWPVAAVVAVLALIVLLPRQP